jgi:hypothetical protein
VKEWKAKIGNNSLFFMIDEQNHVRTFICFVILQLEDFLFYMNFKQSFYGMSALTTGVVFRTFTV